MNDLNSPLWSLNILGGLRLTRFGEPNGAAVERFRTTKAASLFAFLAFRRGAHSRDQLCNLFWPDATAESARNNLRVTLSNLRAILEPKNEVESGSIVQLVLDTVEISSLVHTDTTVFFETLQNVKIAASSKERRLALEAMLTCYGGPLMAGYYSDWIVTEANRLEDLFIVHLRQLLTVLEDADELEAALDVARRAINLAPTREEVLRESMRLGLKNGQHNAVIAEFEAWAASARSREDSVGEATLELLRAAHDLAKPLKTVPLKLLHPAVKSDNSAPLGRSLPGQWTKFFGREAELAKLREWLTDPTTRLVTLTGPGGAGKTRLALEIARSCVNFPQLNDESWFALIEWVPLADLPIASLIPGAILDALRAPRGNEQLKDLVSALHTRQGDAPGARLLLVLDNFEHLFEEGAPLIHALLQAVPELVCLVTSRRRLGFSGERDWPLQPLDVPTSAVAAGKSWIGFEKLAPSSVQLFLDRARLVRPDFGLSSSNADTIAELCARLDGLPLTLELAAARVALFSPSQILAGLDSQLEKTDFTNSDLNSVPEKSLFLAPTSLDWTNQDRSAPQRHRSLRAAIAWSERQLPPPIARFWSQLSVFRGGWTLDAAAFVCGEPDAASFVLALRDISLISLDTREELPRGHQLQALREYAAEGLPLDLKEAAQERHAEYFLNWAETIAPQLGGARVARFLVRFEDERGNLRAALEWHLKHNLEGALRMAVALWWSWELRGRVAEGRHSLARILESAERAFPDLNTEDKAVQLSSAQLSSADTYHLQLVAQARNGAGKLATLALDFENARFQLEKAMDIFKLLQDEAGVADCLYSLGYMWLKWGDVELARDLCDQSIAIYRGLGERNALCDALYNRAIVALYELDFDLVRTLTGERLVIHRAKGEARGVAISLENLGLAALFSGEIEAARTYFSESLSIFENMKEPPSIIRALWGLGHALRAAGDAEASRAAFTKAFNISREHQLLWNWPYLLEAFASLSTEAGDAPRATRLLGGAGMMRENYNEPLPSPMFGQEMERAVAGLRAALGETHFESEWQLGRAMSPSALVEFALGEHF